jgi:hypothetical protein
MKQLFNLGNTGMTRAAQLALIENSQSPTELLARHASGDWGTVDYEDATANDAAVKNGNRILSSYVMPNGDKIWVITESDRSVTTILLPDDY